MLIISFGEKGAFVSIRVCSPLDSGAEEEGRTATSEPTGLDPVGPPTPDAEAAIIDTASNVPSWEGVGAASVALSGAGPGSATPDPAAAMAAGSLSSASESRRTTSAVTGCVRCSDSAGKLDLSTPLALEAGGGPLEARDFFSRLSALLGD